MKMSILTQTTIKKALEVIINTDSVYVANKRKTVAYAKSQFVAFVWSMYYTAKHFDQTFNDFMFEAKKREGLQDAHIETALKQILKEYK